MLETSNLGQIRESRAKFLSYRCLPLWIEQGIEVIKSCTSRLELEQLGEILRTERDWYDDHAMPLAVQPWRDAWAQLAQYLREEEERRKPMLARQLAADSWYAAWQGVLHCCRDFTGLQQLTPEIKHQSQEFCRLAGGGAGDATTGKAALAGVERTAFF
jgi:hypothetical protein